MEHKAVRVAAIFFVWEVAAIIIVCAGIVAADVLPTYPTLGIVICIPIIILTILGATKVTEKIQTRLPKDQ